MTTDSGYKKASYEDWNGLRKIGLKHFAKAGQECINHNNRLLSGVCLDIGAELDKVINQQIKLLVVLNELRNQARNGQAGGVQLGVNSGDLGTQKNLLKYVKKYMKKHGSVSA